MKDQRLRSLWHESWGERATVLELESRKWLCRSCNRTFWQHMPGIQPRMRATEPFRRAVSRKHFDGISRSRLAQREQLSSATVERWFGWYLRLLAGDAFSRSAQGFWALTNTSSLVVRVTPPHSAI